MGLIKSAWSIWWGQWTWPLKLASVVAVVLFFVLIFLGVRGCGKKPVKIDQETLQKVNSGNRKEREEELRKKIEENADVVQTVDNRSTIAETNVVERDRLIDEKVKEADRKIAEAKAQGKDVTGPELECILISSHCD